MSSSREEEEDDAQRQFPIPLPPQTPSTSFFTDSPSLLPEDLLGYTEDFSLLFPDDYYIQEHNPYPSLENTANTDTVNVAHQEHQVTEQAEALQLGQQEQQPTSIGEAREQGEAGPATTTSNSPSSSSCLMLKMKQKKMDHNAKERVRRLQLNTSYLALRSLLPDSHKPKEKWSAPYIIDRAVEHIPQLEEEIEKLKSNKRDTLSELEKAEHLRQAEKLQEKTASVSINEIRKGQVIIQVCHHRNKLDGILSHLLFRLESQGMEVFDASVFDPCEDTSCYHFRIQMDESSVGDDYVAELEEKVVSWLS